MARSRTTPGSRCAACDYEYLAFPNTLERIVRRVRLGPSGFSQGGVLSWHRTRWIAPMKTPGTASPLFPSARPSAPTPSKERGAEAFAKTLDAERMSFALDDRTVGLSVAGRISPSSLTGRDLMSEDRDGGVSVWTPSRDVRPSGRDDVELTDYRVSDLGAGRGSSGLFPRDEGTRGLGIKLDRSMMFVRPEPNDGESATDLSFRVYLLDARSREAGENLRLEPGGNGIDVLDGDRRIASVAGDALARALQRLGA